MLTRLFIVPLLLFFLVIAGCEQDHTYQGEMKNGRPHGTGTLIYQGGAVYEGEFNMGKRCGWGVWEHPNGTSYEGQWQDDLYHGYGILTIPNNLSYEGHFKAGLKHGQGIQTWADGRRYQGQWKEGRRHGAGTMYYPDGSRFEGGWKNGRQHGPGTLYEADGEVLTGEWENGQLESIPVENISLDQSELTLTAEADPEELTASIYPEDASGPEISWSSSDPEVATVEEGLVTPRQSGEAIITATAVGKDVKQQCTVIVTDPHEPPEPSIPVAGISIEQPWLNLREDDAPERLIAVIEPPDADTQTLIWSSNDPQIASVDQQGWVTPHETGRTEITVQTEDGGFTDTCRVTVRRALGFDSD